MIGQLHNYIKGELYVNIIKEIIIYTDKLTGENYELLDVPGFDSPIKEHRDAGLHAIAMADAFLFLTSGQSPSLTQPQMNLLHEIQSYHYEAMQRAFGIITKLDLCQTSAIYQDHYEKAKGELVDKHFNPEQIFSACPRIELLESNSEEYQVINEKIRSFGDLREGFKKSKEALNVFIQYELQKTHMKQLIDLELLPDNLAVMSIDEYIKVQNTENWDQYYYDERFNPTFAKANDWHTTTITQNRSEFIENAKKIFHDRFLELTEEFMQSKHPIAQIMSQTYGYTKLQLNSHLPDNEQREKLSFQLEKIVDKTSNDLAEYFYHHYVCQLEDILNEISPEEKDLYRTRLSLEKCKYETQTLILRVSRPVIMATLRYSHLDLSCKREAISELIHIAPIVAYRIANAEEEDNDGRLVTEIPKLAKLTVAGGNEMVSKLLKALFQL
ncbi:unnamed protein product [Rotaria sp. Silwood2]|nr:unnamed protein product [Rotaria sp. Silwood2]